MKKTNGSIGPVKFFFGVLLTFLILYNISLQGSESISSARIAVGCLSLILPLLKLSPKNKIDASIYLLFIPAPYVLIQFAITRDFGQLSRFLHLFLYSYFGAMMIARISGGINKWLLVFISATSIQAIILLVSFVSIDYRVWAAATLATGGNFGADNIYRAPGLSGDSGSSLSVIQSMGVLSGGFYLFLKRGAINIIERYGIVLLMVLCATSCVVVGRTGLILSVLFITFFIINGSISCDVIFFYIFSLAFAFIYAIQLAQDLLPTNFSVDFFSRWVFGFLYGEDNTTSALSSMPIAPLSLETILGYGLVSVVNGENPSGHDSGFIQGYFSMGLVASFIFYVLYFIVITKLLRWLPQSTRYLLAILFFVVEIKEPFVFKYAIMFLLVGCYESWRLFENRTNLPNENRLSC